MNFRHQYLSLKFKILLFWARKFAQSWTSRHWRFELGHLQNASRPGIKTCKTILTCYSVPKTHGPKYEAIFLKPLALNSTKKCGVNLASDGSNERWSELNWVKLSKALELLERFLLTVASKPAPRKLTHKRMQFWVELERIKNEFSTLIFELEIQDIVVLSSEIFTILKFKTL